MRPAAGKPAPAGPALRAQAPEKASAKAQAAWQRVLDKLERGELKDPTGQYVSKATRVAEGTHLKRPKFDAALPGYPAWYGQQLAKELKDSKSSVPAGAASLTRQPDEPCDGCPPGPPATFTTFISSVGKAGTGNIRDLKLIVGDDNSVSAQQVLGAGYIKLNSDLNKGAGGAYIYLCFTRNSSQVLSGIEYYQGYLDVSPTSFLTSINTKKGSFTTKPRADDRYYDIWVPNQNQPHYWSYTDLNAGAGGEYIYSFQSKSPFVSSYTYIYEVGILSGNSSSITPPAGSGWIKYAQDLNEGSGGDYIYFCYR